MSKKYNFLDCIPKICNKNKWILTDDNIITIVKDNTGMFNKFAQLLFGKPKTSNIHLDEYGSFIWKQINGSNSIYEIAQIVKSEYGDSVEPLYSRIVQYFKILRNNRFININVN